ncbi:MAG TPA: hypothetical protein VHD56_13035, partial [Tepidisphaeraceae bacterium]|nr:hypothetical protein [Tepidisphaeraceae bacterium]
SLVNVTPEKVVCKLPDAGFLLIESGKRIVIDPLPQATPELLAQWVQGSALALTLHQRGFLVLHASGVEVNGKAIAFCGEVGQGKSTTAAAVHARGHRLIADDVVAVRVRPGADPIVMPGFPHMKLMPQTLGFLGEAPENLPLVAGEDVKRLKARADRISTDALPLKAVFVLSEGPDISIERMPLQTALMELTQHLFVGRRVDFLKRTNTAQSHLANITGLIGTIGVTSLKRRKSFDLLPKVIDMVEERVASA